MSRRCLSERRIGAALLRWLGWRLGLLLVVLVAGVGLVTPITNEASISQERILSARKPQTDTYKLTANDGAVGDQFGASAALGVDTAVLGAHWDDDKGSAYVFVRDRASWIQEAKLTAGDGTAGDGFGTVVAISGDTAVISAHGDDDNGDSSGSAYVFVRNGATWSQQAKLTASDGAALDAFGFAAISGDTIVVGAHNDDDSGDSSGSAYIFVRAGTIWTQQAKLTAHDGAVGDHFGWSIAISGDTAIVGALDDDDSGESSGSAYVFVREGTTWTQQAKLTAGDGAAHDEFGRSIAISGDTVIVGAHGNDDNGEGTGSAYVFVRDGPTWTQQAKLTAIDGVAGDFFGWSIAISGDSVLVGAYGDDDNGETSGSVYVFVREGIAWTQQRKLTASDGVSYDHFGYSVAICGTTAVVGAPYDDELIGSAVIFPKAVKSNRHHK